MNTDNTLPQNTEVLLSLDDQKRAWRVTRNTEHIGTLKKHIQHLEDAIDLYNDSTRIAMMEKILIENGLMDLVEKRSSGVFVHKKYLDDERRMKNYYKQLLAVQIKRGVELERFITNVLGKPLGDEPL